MWRPLRNLLRLLRPILTTSGGSGAAAATGHLEPNRSGVLLDEALYLGAGQLHVAVTLQAGEQRQRQRGDVAEEQVVDDGAQVGERDQRDDGDQVVLDVSRGKRMELL